MALILTLAFDAETFAVFDAARRRHFPPERNFIPAHLTLFHALPDDELPAIRDRLAALARATPPLPFTVIEVISLGRGAAFRLDVPGLKPLHRSLLHDWHDRLSPQDRQGLHPHVTVQNKVAPDAARATVQELRAAFAPFDGVATGLLLWHYRGGPWEAAAEFPFQGDRP
ncbi:2'-5' RNA ligase family protein [Tranquillimonas alkanivorans]|uniref:2'-5' RNA ligase superfamily protein n=1 Tax=Tranquillimonas alkanivorans TaxID=441119 RepID=A0A1I5QNI9_9RHOB|nr:2'-5' RNA ligase family protein [Tranquillimonas alkanivorans]SFP47813.1 2'-5' RNA ligase superfamily protein [Tranquillimonas alkanivorans]